MLCIAVLGELLCVEHGSNKVALLPSRVARTNSLLSQSEAE